MKKLQSIFLTNRFFLLFGGIILLFVASFPFAFLFPIAKTSLVIAIAVVVLDILILNNSSQHLTIQRRLPKLFSMGDANSVYLDFENNSNRNFQLNIIDELPFQFQQRDFQLNLKLPGKEKKTLSYQLTPKERGEYTFGNVNVFSSTQLGLVQWKTRFTEEMTIPVYPSIIQMKQFELRAFDRISHQQGIKKIRRLGHIYEFEQIKNYVRGDDFRSINWKASSRRAQLMVNQYEDERAQQVYCIIDKSRAMKMPFNGLSLMDYAINTSLAVSNVALQKYDRAGLLTFSDKIGTTIKADRKANQLNKILTALYKEKERKLEANYELLYHSSRKLIKGRSLLLLFTNFESTYALDRVLPILRRINNLHLLVVVFFENTEIKDYAKSVVESTEEIYLQTIAQQFISEKEQMVQKLRQYGIQAVLTRPQDLTINTINKYLELKSRGLI